MRIVFGFILGYFVADSGGAVEASKTFLGWIATALSYLVEGINWLTNV